MSFVSVADLRRSEPLARPVVASVLVARVLVARVRAARILLACALCLSLFACGGEDAERTALWGDTPVAGLDLRAELSASEVPLLERVELALDLFVADGVDVDFEPRIPEGFVGTVSDPITVPIDGGAWSQYSLRLQPVELGTLTIPPFQVESRAKSKEAVRSKEEPGKEGSGEIVEPAIPEFKASTAEFELVVTTVLEGSSSEVEAPGELFESPLDFLSWRIGLGVLALLVVVILWWRRRVPKIVHPNAIALPAHVKALRELSRLKAMPRIMPDEIDAFYVAVSLVLRTYLEDRFGLHAPDRTTEEFLPEVKESAALDADQQAHLGQFLQQTDLVKFARVVPEASAHDAALAFAEDLVESTREDRVSSSGSAGSDSVASDSAASDSARSDRVNPEEVAS